MFLLKLISRLPFPVLYFLSDIAYVVSYYLVRYRRKLVRKNLRKAFPDKNKHERLRIEREFYRNLCDYGFETLKLLTIPKEELARRMHYRDFSEVSKWKEKNQSVILLASHSFNWEWLLAAGTFCLPMPLDFVYQPQNNEFFNKLSLISRTRFGGYPIERSEVAKETFKRRRILRGICLVADQYPGYKRDKKYLANFLHQQTAFFYGANQLAVVMQYPVVYAQIRKIKRGYYDVVYVPISEPPYESEAETTVANYVAAVEKLIREYPPGWLWSHNRWKKRHLKQKKLKQASAQYPPGSAAS